MNKRFFNLNGYLLINLILVGIILLGLWKKQDTVDTSIRLTSLLLFLVIINAVLVMKESLCGEEEPCSRVRKETGSSGLRSILHSRTNIDQSFMNDALTTVLAQTTHEGMVVLLFEEGGFFSPYATAGAVPQQFSGARFFIDRDEFKVRHPGGLGEEKICKWPAGMSCVPLRSKVTRLNLDLVPLNMFGKCRGLWVSVIGLRKKKRKTPSSLHSLFLESMLALSLCHSQSAEGHAVDMHTGLLRYEGFKKSFDIEIERSERYQQAMTLLLISILRFEEVSPTLQGKIQKSVAGGLRESLRRLDISFSWNKPGTFAAVLTETDQKVAKMVGERIVNSYRKHLKANEIEKEFSQSIFVGFTTYPTDASHGEGLIDMAEEALKTAIQKPIEIVSYSEIHDISHPPHRIHDT